MKIMYLQNAVKKEKCSFSNGATLFPKAEKQVSQIIIRRLKQSKAIDKSHTSLCGQRNDESSLTKDPSFAKNDNFLTMESDNRLLDTTII